VSSYDNKVSSSADEGSNSFDAIAGEMCSRSIPQVSSFVSISADEGVEMGFLMDFFSTACVYLSTGRTRS
jgi:hypothetical protein